MAWLTEAAPWQTLTRLATRKVGTFSKGQGSYKKITFPEESAEARSRPITLRQTNRDTSSSRKYRPRSHLLSLALHSIPTAALA